MSEENEPTRCRNKGIGCSAWHMFFDLDHVVTGCTVSCTCMVLCHFWPTQTYPLTCRRTENNKHKYAVVGAVVCNFILLILTLSGLAEWTSFHPSASCVQYKINTSTCFVYGWWRRPLILSRIQGLWCHLNKQPILWWHIEQGMFATSAFHGGQNMSVSCLVAWHSLCLQQVK